MLCKLMCKGKFTAPMIYPSSLNASRDGELIWEQKKKKKINIYHGQLIERGLKISQIIAASRQDNPMSRKVFIFILQRRE